MHAFTALSFVFRVEIAKRCSFQPIEKFLLKTQNTAAFKLANVTATQNLGQNEIFQNFDVYFRSLWYIFLLVELCGAFLRS